MFNNAKWLGKRYAMPQSLALQLGIDILLWTIIRPETPTAIWLFILLLPGMDLLWTLVSFRRYYLDYRGGFQDDGNDRNT